MDTSLRQKGTTDKGLEGWQERGTPRGRARRDFGLRAATLLLMLLLLMLLLLALACFVFNSY